MVINNQAVSKLKGKTVHNGPPRGGALVTARNVIRLSTGGFKEGKDYKGKQIIGRAEYKIYPINEISNIND